MVIISAQQNTEIHKVHERKMLSVNLFKCLGIFMV